MPVVRYLLGDPRLRDDVLRHDRAGRYDRMSDDVRTLTEQGPLSVREFVWKHAATFTASAKAA